jgi:hypothetical protein
MSQMLKVIVTASSQLAGDEVTQRDEVYGQTEERALDPFPPCRIKRHPVDVC